MENMKFFQEIEYQKELGSTGLGSIIKNMLKSTKVIHVTNINVENVHDLYENACKTIGKIIPMEEDLVTGNKTQCLWTDIRYLPKVSDSFSHSNTRQPLHTDGSYESNAPNISMFYCIEQAKFGGATVFIDGEVLYEFIKEDRPEILYRLQNIPVLFSKGNDSKEKPIFNSNRWTWNYYRASCQHDKDLVKDFHDLLESRIVNSGILHHVNLKRNEAVLFQDEKVIHGRNAFVGNRWLKKTGIIWEEHG
jgi:alpha-ketoglutarate-dependent taurine dioxygenase